MTKASDLSAVGGLMGGKYRVHRLLGKGGMGAVYEAENVMLRCPVAIKVLHPDAPSRADDDPSARFIQEAQAAAKVRHPNVVSVLDIGHEDGVIYIVQEFLTGHDLRAHLKRTGPLEPGEALEILAPVMRGLAAAHACGVIHRDIKPDNIFLCETADGITPKVIDFGVAKMLDDERSLTSTRSGLMVGTAHYMSPEQARGDRDLDARTDVWSLGAVLYQALTGHRPHEAPTPALTLAKIITQPPTPVAHHRPDLPADVIALVERALEPDRDRRIPSMEVFYQTALACGVFEDVTRRSSVPAFSSSVTPRVSSPSVTPTSTPVAIELEPEPSLLLEFSGEVEVSSAREAPRRRWAHALGAGALLVSLFAGGQWLSRSRVAAPVTASVLAPPVTSVAVPLSQPDAFDPKARWTTPDASDLAARGAMDEIVGRDLPTKRGAARTRGHDDRARVRIRRVW